MSRGRWIIRRRPRSSRPEVASRWDSDRLRDAVMVTQKTRRALHASMAAGSGQHWDYNPPRDASQEYVRNHMDWTVAAGRYRFPPADECLVISD